MLIKKNDSFEKNFVSYLKKLHGVMSDIAVENVELLCRRLDKMRDTNCQLFIAGNGGSAANAMHIANDFLYGLSANNGKAIRVNALPSNSSVITCLGNDVGYSSIFSEQLKVLASPGDVLIVLSGSGNSENIINAIKVAKELGVDTHGILGYDGGVAKKLVDNLIHIKCHDMQICEDLQLVICHNIMQYMLIK